MRNRAKCRLCNDVLESFHTHDYVQCTCGEIAIDGGQQYMRVLTKHWDNFLRLDDNDIEIPIKIKEREPPATEIPIRSRTRPTKSELLDSLKGIIEAYEKMPEKALQQPVSHSDFVSLLLIVDALFRSD